MDGEGWLSGKRHKMLLAVPLVLLIISVFALYNNYAQTGDFIGRSVELKGGTLINMKLTTPVDVESLEQSLSSKFGSLIIREIRSFSGNSLLIEAGDTDPDIVIDELGLLGIDTSQYSIQTIGSSLGENFWIQAQIAIITAFIFMAIVVFIIFRSTAPSLAVILAAGVDIIMTLGFMQIFRIDLSLAGLAAILMLIGYSVDTDILLTARMLKGAGEVRSRFMSALKTGLTMTVTAIGALSALILFGISPVLSQIAAILLIGLVFDIINTWITNATLLTWYMGRRHG